MSGRGVIQTSPVGVPGTYGGIDARGALFGNVLPGLFQSGDFAVSQRGAGANMSVDVAQGQAIVTPGNATHQNAYLIRRTNGTAWNTSADGAITWTAADASNPRIDLVCLEVRDTDMDSSGVYQGNIRVVDGTASASATHQLEVAQWPAIPTGLVPIAAIRVPAAATTLTTANITNLNPIAGGRSAALYTTTAETLTSTTLARPATPDALCVYVPSSSARIRVGYKAQWKISVASGTQGIGLFVNGTQMKMPTNTGAPLVVEFDITSLGTFYSHVASVAYTSTGFTLASGVYSTIAGATADVSDVATGQLFGLGASATASFPGSAVEIMGLAAGWYVFEHRFKTSANTLSVRERHMWAEVVG